jgi:hypothetical protein
MATNPPKGDGHRNGAVRDRSQVHNPKNDRWTKRGPDGRFMDQKADRAPFKGVRKEKCPVRPARRQHHARGRLSAGIAIQVHAD